MSAIVVFLSTLCCCAGVGLMGLLHFKKLFQRYVEITDKALAEKQESIYELEEMVSDLQHSLNQVDGSLWMSMTEAERWQAVKDAAREVK